MSLWGVLTQSSNNCDTVHTVDHLPPQPHLVCLQITRSVGQFLTPPFYILKPTFCPTHPSHCECACVDIRYKNEHVRGHVTMMCSAKCFERSSVTFVPLWNFRRAEQYSELGWFYTGTDQISILQLYSLKYRSTTAALLHLEIICEDKRRKKRR